MTSNCPHCSFTVEVAAVTCPRCGGALSRRSRSPLPSHGQREPSERREATVLFCDLGGYTQWNEEEDPEEVASAMDTIRLEAVRIFESHGGIVNQFVGDEVMGLFGIISSHEDDPCRAVAAALALHAFLRGSLAARSGGAARALRLHSGIETGLIYARVHDLRSGLFEVTGDAVNTAARLRAHAPADQLLLGPETQKRVAPFFALEPLAPVALHGKSLPIVPQRVLGASGSTSFFDAATARGLTRYVERERELLVLRDAWEQARAAHGGVISIGGGPGVGKTRLLHEFRAYVTQQAHGEAALVLHGRCSAYRNVAPYQPFIDALTGPLASLREQYPLSNQSMTALTYLFAPGAAQTPLPERSHDAALRDAIIDGLTEVLITIAQQRPLLLMLEDWHCADDASRATLRQLSQRIDASRILLTINYRSTELTAQAQPKARVHIDLAPLDVAMTEAMARSLLGGGRMPAGLSDFVHSRTLGNPFFVEEICRALLERGTCVQQGDAIVLVKPLLQFRAPSTVQAMVRARIDRLPGAHRDLLRLAAVIGAQFTFELIEASATGELPQPSAADTPARAALLAQLAELETQDLIHRVDSSLPPVYRFKHAITQEVVYESLPVQQRRHHHGRLAQLIEARCPKDELETQYEPLAHHYQRSAHTDKAIAYSVLAGDKAWRAFALEQAARQYRHALGVLARVAPADDAAKLRHIDVSLSWARASVYNPDAEQVTALHDSLRWASELADQRRTCLCLNWLSWLEHALGNQRSALAYSEQFRQAATELGETRLLAQALINAGVSHAMATDYGQAVASIEQGLQARARFTGTAYGYAQGYLAMICGDQGDFERAYAFLAQASAAIGEGSHITLQGPLLIQRAMIECWQESWQACIATSMRAREIAERIEGNYILGMSLSLEGHARFMASGDEAALGLQREAVALLDAHGIRLHMSMTLGLLAESLAHAGAYDEAEATLGAARARIAEHDRLGEVAALRAAAWIAGMRDRDVGSAKRWMQEAVAAAEAKHSPREQALCEAALRKIVHAQGGR